LNNYLKYIVHFFFFFTFYTSTLLDDSKRYFRLSRSISSLSSIMKSTPL
jgi:hypothetical protein